MNENINEHNLVALLVDLPEHRLKSGDIGTVVHVHSRSSAFEVEFVSRDARTIAVVTVDRCKVQLQK